MILYYLIHLCMYIYLFMLVSNYIHDCITLYFRNRLLHCKYVGHVLSTSKYTYSSSISLAIDMLNFFCNIIMIHDMNYITFTLYTQY